jgi:hypothetical protein
MNNKTKKIIIWSTVCLLVACFSGYLYIPYSIHQTCKLLEAGIRSNMDRPHSYIFNEIIKKYPELRDSTKPIPTSEILMTIECYQKGKIDKIGTYTDNFIGLCASDEKHRKASHGIKIDSIRFTVTTPTIKDINGSAILIDNKWEVAIDRNK